MKISIITPTFNSELTIEDTLKSIDAQIDVDIEHIVIDGLSSDNTLGVIEKYKKPWRRVVSEKDQGIYDAMNKGIALATGEILAILNSDDYYFDHWVLQHVVDRAVSSNAKIIYGNLVFINYHTRKIVRYWKSSPFRKGLFLSGWQPPHPAFFVNRSVYKNFGVFDTRFSISADDELMLRFLEKEGVSQSYLDKTLTVMRTGGESNRSLKNVIRGNHESYQAFRKNNIPVTPFYFFRRAFYKLSQIRSKNCPLSNPFCLVPCAEDQ